ncbi:MAG: ribbon-helix-helix domain-containing protein [Promethearchaeota archaeon]
MSKQIITINIPDSYLSALETLIKLKFFSNRSQIVRIALEEFLQKENKFFSNLQPNLFYSLQEKRKKAIHPHVKNQQTPHKEKR